MSAKRRGASVKPVGAVASSGWEYYELAGNGNDIDYHLEYNNGYADGYTQIWYKTDAIAPRVLATLVGAAPAAGTVGTPDSRSGPNAFVWAKVLNQAGDVIETGALVDVTD